MDVLCYASFSRDDDGGNPAGVVLLSHMPSDDAMQAVAAEVGYSETAFALPVEGGQSKVSGQVFHAHIRGAILWSCDHRAWRGFGGRARIRGLRFGSE